MNHTCAVVMYSGTSLRQTPLGTTKSSIIERVSSGQEFIILHYDCGLYSGFSKSPL